MTIIEKLKQPAGRKLEFKKEFPSRSDFLKTVVAFSNGAGGELIIGVTDKQRKIMGIADPVELEEKIINSIYDSVYPIISPYIYAQNFDGKTLLIVKIMPGGNKPYFIKSKGLESGVFVRFGSSSRKADVAIIDELRRQNRRIEFVSEMNISRKLTDLDDKVVQKYCTKMGFDTVSNELLAKLNIIQKNNGDYFPTMAGLILFGKSDLSDFGFATVRVSKFQGTTSSNLIETKEYSIPLLPNLELIYENVTEFAQKEPVLEGLKRGLHTIVPDFAIRESIINAIVHRDYSIQGSSVKINIFDDRIEIISPGILPGQLEISDLGTGLSFSRNRTIVNIFRKLKWMEELGIGISTIKKLYSENELEPPSFFEQGNFFKVILPQNRITKI